MANRLVTYEPSTAKNTSLAGTSSGQVAGWNGTDWVATSQPYDLSGEYPGSVTASSTMFRFVSVRAFTIKDSTGTTVSRAYCGTAPSSSVTFSVKDDGVEFATITFGASATTGTIALTGTPSDYAVASNRTITITAPASVFGIKDVYWTFFAVTP